MWNGAVGSSMNADDEDREAEPAHHEEQRGEEAGTGVGHGPDSMAQADMRT